MKTQETIAALDPGRDKCGIAVLDIEARPLFQKVIETLNLEHEINDIYAVYMFKTLVIGDGTTSKEAKRRVEKILPDVSLVLENEYRTTDMAKKAYWQAHPPRGFLRLLPLSMLVPPVPVDDFVAIILARRFLKKTLIK